MGAKAGLPDILLVAHGRLFGLELKAGERGRLSEVQKTTHEEMRRAGAVVGTAGTVDEAIDLARSPAMDVLANYTAFQQIRAVLGRTA